MMTTVVMMTGLICPCVKPAIRISPMMMLPKEPATPIMPCNELTPSKK